MTSSSSTRFLGPRDSSARSAPLVALAADDERNDGLAPGSEFALDPKRGKTEFPGELKYGVVQAHVWPSNVVTVAPSNRPTLAVFGAGG